MSRRKKGGVDIGDYISLMFGAAVMTIIFILVLQNTSQKRENKKIEIDEKKLDIDSYDILWRFIENNRQGMAEGYSNDEMARAATEYFGKYYGSRNMGWALEIRDSSGVSRSRIESNNFGRSYKRQSSISIEIPTPKKDFLSFRLYYREIERLQAGLRVVEATGT